MTIEFFCEVCGSGWATPNIEEPARCPQCDGMDDIYPLYYMSTRSYTNKDLVEPVWEHEGEKYWEESGMVGDSQTYVLVRLPNNYGILPRYICDGTHLLDPAL